MALLLILALVALVHGTFGVYGAIHLWRGFTLARSRKEVIFVSLIAAISLAMTVGAWGWGTTQFDRRELAFIVGFGWLFIILSLNFFFLAKWFERFGSGVFHGVKAGTGLAIPAATLYYMIYMFRIPN